MKYEVGDLIYGEENVTFIQKYKKELLKIIKKEFKFKAKQDFTFHLCAVFNLIQNQFDVRDSINISTKHKQIIMFVNFDLMLIMNENRSIDENNKYLLQRVLETRVLCMERLKRIGLNV